MVKQKGSKSSLLHSQILKSNLYKNIYIPKFYQLTNENDKEEFYQLISDTPNLQVYDELNGQLAELIKSRNPNTTYSGKDLEKAVEIFLGNTPSEEYGIWVYYPWSNRLVHLLDKLEFIEVRTNRNCYKITPQERDILSTKKVGVIGLSVGQSVAVTMAMERSFGEIRLADFDLLELTNLNRIRTGIHNLGISKAVSVAREIAEIDPFLNVVCYTNGITEENMEDFFLKGGKLDALIDECDGLDIKILARYKAKELRVPVLMEASDKGLLDVERFDLEPDRPILHGLIDHLDTSQIKSLKTNEDKIPFLLAINGFENTSSRLRSSMLEITQSITTWPQLASAVTLGGGLTADVWRRVALDQYHDSGRYYIDVEELVKDEIVESKNEQNYSQTPPKALSWEDMKNIYHSSGLRYSSHLILEEAKIKDIVQSAILAPSGGNNQPWKWLYTNGVLLLFHDKSRLTPFMDFQNFASYMSHGATIENLVIKAGSLNLEVSIDMFPVQGNDLLIAAIRFFHPAKTNESTHLFPFRELNEYIPQRITNRNNGPRQDIDSAKLEMLKKVASSVAGAELQFITDAREMDQLGDIIGEADRFRFLHPQGHDELFNKEIRWNQQEAETSRDGIDLSTFELTPSEQAGFRIAKSQDVIQNLRKWNAGAGFGKISRKAVASASAIGILRIPVDSPGSYVNAGRALERVWLSATSENIAFHPMLAPLAFFLRLDLLKDESFYPEMKEGVKMLWEKYTRIVKPIENKRDVFLFRISIADKPEVLSLRKPIEEVLFIE